MKHIYLFLLLQLIPNSIWSQTILFKCGFENDLTTDWGATNNISSMPKFEINTLSKRTGNNGFQMQFNSAPQKGNLETAKNLSWENGITYRITFYYKAITPISNSESNIKIFANNGVTKLTQVNFPLTATTWTKYTTEFTSTVTDNTGSVLFSIRPSATDSGDIYFDDIQIEKLPPISAFFTDIKTKDIVSDPSIKWIQFGPGMSGNNTSFYPHPTDSNTHFTSPNMGNSYRSTDRGFTYETIMNEDAGAWNSGMRGPTETYSIDFSRSNANFGFSTGKRLGDLFQSSDKGKSWSRVMSVQAQAGNAYLSCIAVDPQNENVWYLGAGRMRDYGRVDFPLSQPNGSYTHNNSQGKIWKTTDKGANWTLINSGLHSSAEIETIYTDPTNSNIVYAGTNYGFYKSINGGTTWILKSNGITNNVIRSLSMYYNPSITGNQVVLYALSNIMWKADGSTLTDDTGGIFKSTDKGETWTNISGNIALDMRQFSSNSGIKKSYYNNVAFYFGITYDEAVAQYPNMPSKITQRFNQITVDPKNPDNIYLVNNYSNASGNNFKPGQLWRTKDGGTKWFVTVRNGKNWNTGSPDLNYWTNRGNPLNTNIQIKYKSDWVNRDDYEQKSCNFIQFNADGSVLYTQMAKIGLVSYDNGDSWVDIDDEETTPNSESWVGAGNSNLPGHGFYQSENLPNKVLCPSGENSLWITNSEGILIRPDAQGASVRNLTSGEHSVSSVAVDPTNPSIWFATFFRQDKRGQLLKSTDSGITWATVGTPVPLPWPEPAGGGDQAVHQMCLLIDKNNTNNMYFCVPRSSIRIEWVGDSVTGWGVHRSTDGGTTWTEINTGLPSSLDVARIAIDPNASNILYAAVIGNNGGLYKTTDYGSNWAQVSTTTVISGTSGINDIHFDKDGKAYITSGFNNVSDNGGGLWVSDDNMQTWSKIFDYPWTHRVEVAKYDTRTILVSTLPNTTIGQINGGTYLSKDSGNSWIKFNKGNGQSDRVNDIAIDYNTPGKYYASTRGSGWYVATDPNPNTLLKVNNHQSDSNSPIIYPNPTKNVVKIVENLAYQDFKIYSMNGTLVKQFTKNESNEYSVSDLATGIYIYVIKNNTDVYKGKLIKQ
ncbi:T9SS type A sorting domain-containing protein [Flavobacterium ovatum]|uniref:VPS10 domain-containing protein n=1 Tax=Flavobacterium ovatum TaxID=1928857 RepID=UPI0034506B60